MPLQALPTPALPLPCCGATPFLSNPIRFRPSPCCHSDPDHGQRFLSRPCATRAAVPLHSVPVLSAPGVASTANPFGCIPGRDVPCLARPLLPSPYPPSLFVTRRTYPLLRLQSLRGQCDPVPNVPRLPFLLRPFTSRPFHSRPFAAQPILRLLSCAVLDQPIQSSAAIPIRAKRCLFGPKPANPIPSGAADAWQSVRLPFAPIRA